jgi:hypothetical protein
MRRIVFGATLVFAVICLGTKRDYDKPSLDQLMARVPKTPNMQCSSTNGLEDKSCTPGLPLTAKVSDICNDTSTSTIRPPEEYTEALKKIQIEEYGYTDKNLADYEEDHLISLEIGGHPDDPQNLWPEPHKGSYNSYVEDKVEDWLHDQICSGAMTPEEAQKGIVEDWRQYIEKAGAATPSKAADAQ